MNPTQSRTMVLTYEDEDQAHYTDAQSVDGDTGGRDITIVLEKKDWPVLTLVPGNLPEVIRVDISVEAW